MFILVSATATLTTGTLFQSYLKVGFSLKGRANSSVNCYLTSKIIIPRRYAWNILNIKEEYTKVLIIFKRKWINIVD